MIAQIRFRREALDSDVARSLVAALDAELKGEYPGEGETFFRLDPEEVAEGRGAFLVCYAAKMPVACGAIRKLDDGTAEIKRMYVDPAVRRAGMGRRVVGALEAEARSLGVGRIVLETGTRQHGALALYERCGFERTPAFGEYVDSPVSICMAKDIRSAD